MVVDPAVLAGLLFLAAEFAALAALGYVVSRAVLRQTDDRVALAQGLVIGPALWGVAVNFALYLAPGLAGAAVGWGLALTLGAVLVWRSPRSMWPRPRVIAGFTAAVVALFWAALASRQLLGVGDLPIHLGLAATIRAGAFPPELPWNPGMPLHYHHGPSLLVGLLAPPAGPDLAFVSELLGAYAWTSFALVIVTALLQRGSWPVALMLAPLLVTVGAWTTGEWTWRSEAEGLLSVPVAAGLPAAGLRASLAEVFWPTVGLDATFPAPMLPDIWKPEFTLGYALSIVTLGQVARGGDQSWPALATLSVLVGFLGLLATTLVPVVLVLWLGLIAVRMTRWEARSVRKALLSCCGPVVAGLLLLGGGGAFTGMLARATPSGLELAWNFDWARWSALGTLDVRPGGLAVLGLGPLAVGAAALALRLRDRLVAALVAGTALLVVAGLVLHYRPAPWDLIRFEGHARNFALAALLLALASRLHSIQSAHSRYAAGAVIAGLVIWPTVVEPARHLGLSVGNGIQLANATSAPHESRHPNASPVVRRTRFPGTSDRLATYIRNHTSVDARVLCVEPPYSSVFLSTGRPNAAGFVGVTHQIYHQGPEYLDVVHFLEPGAIRRLGIAYVHATDTWIAELPERGRNWLSNPNLFERIMRDGDESLYRVRPAFRQLDTEPTPHSFEALRSIPPSTVVYLHPQTPWLSRLRLASVLSHTQLVGDGTGLLFARTPLPWTVGPPGQRRPDLVVLPAPMDPWMFPQAGRLPIWRNSEVAIYAPTGTLKPVAAPGPPPPAPPLTVRLTDLFVNEGRITFTAGFVEHAPERWTSQDWVVVEVDDGPWAIPKQPLGQNSYPEVAKWFDGLLGPGGATSSHVYRLDAPTASLAVRSNSGEYVRLAESAGELDPGYWVLALRLRRQLPQNVWRQVALLPVLRFHVSVDGHVTYTVFENALHGPGAPQVFVKL